MPSSFIGFQRRYLAVSLNCTAPRQRKSGKLSLCVAAAHHMVKAIQIRLFSVQTLVGMPRFSKYGIAVS